MDKQERKETACKTLLASSVAAVTFGMMLAPMMRAQTYPEFEKRFASIRSRPEFRHARFGAEFYSIEDGKVLYAWNGQELFIPASTTKVLTVGTALELLGPEFRFHTKVYRTGALKHGTLEGNLVLVGSGDPNLSNRIQANGSMVFENEDHSYDTLAEARAVPGNPLAVIVELARKIAGCGIQRVTGRVAVDASLFPEGERELGTDTVISPVVVNDNLVDVTVKPGGRQGEAATMAISPRTRYVDISNDVKTGPPGSAIDLQWINDKTNADGTHTVSLSGSMPAGNLPKLKVYKIPVPSRFAEVVLTEALEAAGVRVGALSKTTASAWKNYYKTEFEIAEHVSPPLREEAKITLKVSQNLHASMMPLILGAYLGKGTDHAQAGFDLERGMLDKAKLDITGAVQNDGAGGDALFAPDFMVSFLLHLHERSFFQHFQKALPVLGVDGTLFNIGVSSPAAGHVFAKTGTLGEGNALRPHGGVVGGKGLAGFIDAKDGRHLAFASYINFVPVETMDEAATKMVGTALGEIAAAGYDSFGRDQARR